MVYRGIYLPSLSGKLQDERLEFAYLRYAHRQRQKSLMLINSADIWLKILLLLRVYCVIDNVYDESLLPSTCDLVHDQQLPSLVFWIVLGVTLNVILGKSFLRKFYPWSIFVSFFS